MLRFKTRNFLTGEELSPLELMELIKTADQLKKNRQPSDHLKNKTIALIFEKPSLRTRVSFAVGVNEMGGHPLELLGSQKKHEEPEDTMRVLQGMVQGIMLRTFEHSTLDRMATVAKIPIINGLSDDHHPCQILADLTTLFQTFDRLEGLKLCYVGDGNNMLHSLMLMLPQLGIDVHYACPTAHLPKASIVERANHRAPNKIKFFESPLEAAKGCHAIYTDVWTSMGFESQQNSTRLETFRPYQVNKKIFSQAEANAIILHCLPMVRDQEITSEMADHPQSKIFEQAENRLHAQKALMMGLY